MRRAHTSAQREETGAPGSRDRRASPAPPPPHTRPTISSLLFAPTLDGRGKGPRTLALPPTAPSPGGRTPHTPARAPRPAQERPPRSAHAVPGALHPGDAFAPRCSFQRERRARRLGGPRSPRPGALLQSTGSQPRCSRRHSVKFPLVNLVLKSTFPHKDLSKTLYLLYLKLVNMSCLFKSMK